MPEVKRRVVGGQDKVAAVVDLDERCGGGGLQVLVVAGEKLEAQKVVAGDEALDLVENREGIEGAELWFEIVGGEPDGVTVGLAGLRAAGLAHVGAGAFAEGDEGVHVGAHLVGDADDHLEVGADAGAVSGFVDQLEVAVAVGDGAGLFVEVRGGKDDVGVVRGLGEEHLLYDDEGVLEDGRIDTVAGDRVGADDVEGGEFAPAGRFEDLKHVEAGVGGGVVLAEGGGAGDGSVAGEHVGEQAHVGCAARVGVVGEERELAIRQRGAEVEEPLEVGAAELGADEDEELLFGADGVAEVVQRGCVCAGARKGFGGGVVSGDEAGECAVAEGSDVREGFGLAAELDLCGVGDVDAAAIVADVGADVPRSGGGLDGGVAAENHDGRGGEGIAQGGRAVRLAGEGLREGDVVGGAVVVDVVGAENRARELLEEVGLFVGDAVASR